MMVCINKRHQNLVRVVIETDTNNFEALGSVILCVVFIYFLIGKEYINKIWQVRVHEESLFFGRR